MVPVLTTAATRRRITLVAVAAVLVFVTACGGDDSDPDVSSQDTTVEETETETDPAPTEAGSDGQSADEAAPDEAAEGPVTRLVSVTYNGLPSYEFTYDDSGTPTGHTVFHPVTGEPQNRFTVETIDDDGNITSVAAENLSTGVAGSETFTYDDDGRVLTQSYSSPSGSWTTTFAYDGSTVTMTTDSGTSVYTFDDDGNILTEVSDYNGLETTMTNLTFDDSPNPFTMTGGMLVQMWSTNNALTWTPDAGCEYVEDLTYDGDLVVASHAEGCGVTHDYTFTYAEF